MNKITSVDYVQAIIWKNNRLLLLDQRLLPGTTSYVECSTAQDVYDAVKSMVVRGAPAIGICAAYGAALSARHHSESANFRSLLLKDLEALNAARPTAVNLMWAVAKCKALIDQITEDNELPDAIFELALHIHKQDIESNEKIGDLAVSIFNGNDSKPFKVMTHCNAGSLATGGYGTALGVIRSAWRAGLVSHVHANETRPWMQGSRLTAWELSQSSIPVTLNTEGSSATLMSENEIKWVVVGADRIAANGDVANKVGTYMLAINAKYHGVKFMVAAPSSTIDMSTLSGADISIEHRSSDEITKFGDNQIAPTEVSAYNPVFDVTPASLIDCIVTEKGVIHNPSAEALKAVFS